MSWLKMIVPIMIMNITSKLKSEVKLTTEEDENDYMGTEENLESLIKR